MAEVRLVDIKKIYPNQGGTKKKKGDVPEKKHNLQITEEGVVEVQQFFRRPQGHLIQTADPVKLPIEGRMIVHGVLL